MTIEQLLKKRNSTTLMLCMVNKAITGINYTNELFRGECECNCYHDDCNCSDFDCDCDCDCDV